MRCSSTGLSHCNHVVERLESGVEAGIARLRIVTQVQNRDMVVAADALQNGHHVNLGRAARRLKVNNAIESLFGITFCCGDVHGRSGTHIIAYVFAHAAAQVFLVVMQVAVRDVR